MGEFALILATFTIADADAPTLVDAAAAGGFAGVSLRLVPSNPGDDFMPLLLDRALTKTVIKRLAHHGLCVYDIESFVLKPDTDVARWKPAIELAAELGAQQFLVSSADSDVSRVSERLAAFGDLAGGYGMSASLEFMPFRAVNSLKSAEEVVRRSNRDNVGILIDALHLIRSGGSAPDVRSLQPDRIGYFQICDARATAPDSAEALRAEARADRLLPGTGSLPLMEIVESLPLGTTISVEAPCAGIQDLPALERARVVGDATRQFLAGRRVGRTDGALK